MMPFPMHMRCKKPSQTNNSSTGSSQVLQPRQQSRVDNDSLHVDSHKRPLNGDEILKEGLFLLSIHSTKLLSWGEKQKRHRFCTDFGKEPEVYASIWNDLQLHNTLDDSVEELAKFLWTLYRLTNYPSESHLATRTGFSEKTLRDYIWTYIKRLETLALSKINWKDEWSNPCETTPIFFLSVDGIHCPIQEPTVGHKYSKNPKYYSHKFNTAALSYEVALSVFSNEVAWINGPFPAGTGDRDIFRAGLQAKIPKGQKVIADSAYVAKGLPMIRTANNADNPSVRIFKRRVRMRHESFYGKLHVFNALNTAFRHGEKKHRKVFYACVGICAYQIERVPLMDP